MSTATIAIHYPIASPPPIFQAQEPGSAVPTTNRRRASFEQGRALEILGHAIEYLVDSRMFLIHEPATRADSEATQILMRLSRNVFADCTEVIPPAARLRLWLKLPRKAQPN